MDRLTDDEITALLRSAKDEMKFFNAGMNSRSIAISNLIIIELLQRLLELETRML